MHILADKSHRSSLQLIAVVVGALSVLGYQERVFVLDTRDVELAHPGWSGVADQAGDGGQGTALPTTETIASSGLDLAHYTSVPNTTTGGSFRVDWREALHFTAQDSERQHGTAYSWGWQIPAVLHAPTQPTTMNDHVNAWTHGMLYDASSAYSKT
jgi:hypothetical protein